MRLTRTTRCMTPRHAVFTRCLGGPEVIGWRAEIPSVSRTFFAKAFVFTSCGFVIQCICLPYEAWCCRGKGAPPAACQGMRGDPNQEWGGGSHRRIAYLANLILLRTSVLCPLISLFHCNRRSLSPVINLTLF